MQAKLWPQAQPYCQSPGELGQTSEKPQVFLCWALKACVTWTRRTQRDSAQSPLTIFPCTLISACPEQEKGDLGKEESEGGGEKEEEEGRRLIIDSPQSQEESLSELVLRPSSCVWPTSNTEAASDPCRIGFEEENLDVVTPRRHSKERPVLALAAHILKRVQQTSPKGGPLPLELRAFTPYEYQCSLLVLWRHHLYSRSLYEKEVGKSIQPRDHPSRWARKKKKSITEIPPIW